MIPEAAMREQWDRTHASPMPEGLSQANAHSSRITDRVIAYLDEAASRISSDPEVADYERGFDDATRGMAAKVKRLLNGDAK